MGGLGGRALSRALSRAACLPACHPACLPAAGTGCASIGYTAATSGLAACRCAAALSSHLLPWVCTTKTCGESGLVGGAGAGTHWARFALPPITELSRCLLQPHLHHPLSVPAAGRPPRPPCREAHPWCREGSGTHWSPPGSPAGPPAPPAGANSRRKTTGAGGTVKRGARRRGGGAGRETKQIGRGAGKP